MSRRFDVVTFDCYGTLVDWESGIAEAFLRQAELDRVPLDRESVLAAYNAVEPVIERPPYKSYRAVLAQTALQVAGRFGWDLSPDRAKFLAASLPLWRPFPDTNPALTELVKGYSLGILSNIDDDLLAGTRGHLSASFDFVVTAQQVRSYKPARDHFLEARERIGEETRWLHAAQSWFHDVVPASALGIPVAWINRKGEPRPDGPTPEVELRDLAGLAEWLRSPEA